MRGSTLDRLGLHRETETLACFLDDTLQPFPLYQQLEYFLGIKTNKPPELPELRYTTPTVQKLHRSTKSPTEQITKRKRHSQGKEWKVTADQCRQMLNTSSIPANHPREILLGPLAAFLKDVDGLSKEACGQRLPRWSYAVSSRSSKELEYDVGRQVDWIFRRGVRLSSGKLVELTEEQKKVIGVYIYDLLHTPRGHDTYSRLLDQGQRDRAMAPLIAVGEYLRRLILKYGGWCYVSFSTITEATGVNPKRVQKWLPLICGEPWLVSLRNWRLPNFRQQYRGRMFIRVNQADYRGRQAQGYMLSEELAADFGVDVFPAKNGRGQGIWNLA